MRPYSADLRGLFCRYLDEGMSARAAGRIVAPCVLDGPINGESFTAWVDQFLIPALEPGAIVVIDNLGSHKRSQVRRLLKAAGIRPFFLPPCSPDSNPIAEMFSKLKRLLRKAKERTLEATWQRIGKLLDHFPPPNAQTTSAAQVTPQYEAERP